MLQVVAEEEVKPSNKVIVKRRNWPCVDTQIKPGEVRNPNGRPPAGLVILEWVNVMAGWTDAEVAEVLKDKTASKAKKTAARVWQHASSTKLNSSGNPIAGSEVDRILDRTVGKAIQRAEVLALGSESLDPTALDETELATLHMLLSKACRRPLTVQLPGSQTSVSVIDK